MKIYNEYIKFKIYLNVILLDLSKWGVYMNIYIMKHNYRCRGLNYIKKMQKLIQLTN